MVLKKVKSNLVGDAGISMAATYAKLSLFCHQYTNRLQTQNGHSIQAYWKRRSSVTNPAQGLSYSKTDNYGSVTHKRLVVHYHYSALTVIQESYQSLI